MNVLMINGSPRKSGNTSIALAEIAGRLEKLGIESEIVWIGNKPLPGSDEPWAPMHFIR